MLRFCLNRFTMSAGRCPPPLDWRGRLTSNALHGGFAPMNSLHWDFSKKKTYRTGGKLQYTHKTFALVIGNIFICFNCTINLLYFKTSSPPQDKEKREYEV